MCSFRHFLALVCLAILAFVGMLPVVVTGAEPTEVKIPFEPTDQYAIREVEGWKVFLNRKFEADEPELCAETLALLKVQLYQITRMVPREAVARLRKIPAWVELAEPHHPCMCYHPDAGWLREHDMNPDKARCIEVANAKNFLTWTKQQPWMVFHELAHGYHHQVVESGFENGELAAALAAAKEERLYEDVLHINGRRQRHYALTNQQEYFAEQSEAFFGTNDFYPFVRSELERHDPRMFALLKKLWEVDSRDGK
ncbi:MAG: hypothetical protein HY290_25605 [Planctomycetia bacterium]|nr:hypothetical protein [Planctomycetia bacterium]